MIVRYDLLKLKVHPFFGIQRARLFRKPIDVNVACKAGATRQEEG
jgi:hypothetical protein